ncbi:aldo/keto reductase [Portibacter lacus]|uniref:Protein tas n=1 Tax=Portibacter lacus TaxID=1099794 RepID=A0AA37WDX5_9BACT|nr:aldo/keto reductase [Portibacter lacus]GLR15585.1 aldo/keto reductase [Portibacter lacus]
MKYSKLGNSDIKVSKICLGTMTFGRQNTEAEGHAQLDYALDHEVNFIDTAELYAVPSEQPYQGKTEEIIGTWLKKSGRRKDIILGTKITGPSKPLSFIRPKLNFSKEQIHLALDKSMKRLQTDYVDLYQLHWPERKTNFFGKRGYVHHENDEWQDNFGEILNTMDDLVKEGRIRHWGISNETPWGMMHHLEKSAVTGKSRIVSIQNPYSLLNRLFEVGLAEMAIREKVGLLAYSPMAFGLLSGKYHNGNDRPEDRINKFEAMSRYSNDRAHEATRRYMKIAEEAGISVAQLALAFVNQQAFVTANIIGATNMEQLKENIDSIHVTLSDETLAKINEVHEEIPNPAP